MKHLLLSWNILLCGKWQFSESQNMGTSFSFAWGDILCNLKRPFSWPVLFQDCDSFSFGYVIISTYTPPQSNPTPSELEFFPYGGNPRSVHPPHNESAAFTGEGIPDRFPRARLNNPASRLPGCSFVIACCSSECKRHSGEICSNLLKSFSNP